VMNQKRPYIVEKEALCDAGTDLTSFYFRYGANFYVFSYEKNGVTRHTLIDTGDSEYEDRILSILTENGIDPGNIERIIITHRHHDHCGLAEILAKEPGARIMAHSNFRDFVEGKISSEERRWLGKFDPSSLQKCKMEYLTTSGKNGVIRIDGVDFPTMAEPIKIGDNGKLTILTCPESASMHSPDQLLILYSACNYPHSFDMLDRNKEDLRSTDDIFFSGDLWLMHGPLFDKGFRHFLRHLKFVLYRIKALMSGKGTMRRDPREQDPEAKEALKKGFYLVTVKPGHGREFLGSRIIPKSFHADRDLLIELGYPMDANKSLLESVDIVPKVAAIREGAYTAFIEEILLWNEMGYSPGETTELLIRVYREQSGGGVLVEQDRKERRERIEETLARLKDDPEAADELRSFAEATLSKIESEFHS